MLGVVLQRALAVACTLTGGIILVWSQSERLLLLLGQHPSTAAHAARFLIGISPGLLAAACVEVLRRFLAAQVSTLSLVLHSICFLCCLLDSYTYAWLLQAQTISHVYSLVEVSIVLFDGTGSCADL